MYRGIWNCAWSRLSRWHPYACLLYNWELNKTNFNTLFFQRLIKFPSFEFQSLGYQCEKFKILFSEEHFFYLAFENAVCKDYVTEKFWRLKKLIVPIVLKRSLVSRFAKDKYFIAADDFDSPKALVEHLVYLSQNMTEYKRWVCTSEVEFCGFGSSKPQQNFISDEGYHITSISLDRRSSATISGTWNGQKYIRRRSSTMNENFVRFVKWR